MGKKNNELKQSLKNSTWVKQYFDSDVPKPEDLLLGVRYSFTLNPNDITQPADYDDFTKWSYEIQSKLENCRSCHIQVYIEYSKAFRLHFHGYITIHNNCRFYASDLKFLQEWSNVSVDSISDNDVWTKYILKNQSNMKELHEDYGLQLYYDNHSKRLVQ